MSVTDTSALFAISPLDGRYAVQMVDLRTIASEYGLMRFRLIVEIQWLIHLSQEPLIQEVPAFSAEALHFLEQISLNFNEDSAQQIKQFEATTRHDVKALEYYLKSQLEKNTELEPYVEFVHFACTSEDINNLAYALMLKSIGTEVLLPQLQALCQQLRDMAHQYASQPMLARTHGQPASPTTLGKELANTLARLESQKQLWENTQLFGKINGAVGNYNAHLCAYPEIFWPDFSHTFVEKLGLGWNAYTTQIEPHDAWSAWFHAVTRLNTICIDACRDIWGYISLGYFIQQFSAHEVGSSTMPHKINPIDFENAEGNLGIANALFIHFAEKLPISRWQRDLSDSTVIRNIGVACGHSLLAYQMIQRGLSKLAVNAPALEADLDKHWEVLTEAVQTVMRRYRLEAPYEQLKALTRGRDLTADALRTFIEKQALPDAAKKRLLQLSPRDYIGLAAELAQKI